MNREGTQPYIYMYPFSSRKQLVFEHAFDMHTDQFRVQPTPLTASGSLEHYTLAVNHAREKYSGTRDNPGAQSLLKLFKLSNPKLGQLAYLASPILSYKKHIKAAAIPSSPFLPSHNWPWCFPTWLHMEWGEGGVCVCVCVWRASSSQEL